jgi:hypothetical protein
MTSAHSSAIAARMRREIMSKYPEAWTTRIARFTLPGEPGTAGCRRPRHRRVRRILPALIVMLAATLFAGKFLHPPA